MGGTVRPAPGRLPAAGGAARGHGGEAAPDAELARASTVPAGVVAECHRYLAAGGPANVANLLRFVSDTVLMTGHGFDPPTQIAAHGIWDGAGIGAPGVTRNPDRPLIAVVFYRAHLVGGNTTYVADMCAALEAAGADALAIFTYSLRADADGAVPAVALAKELGVDVVITSTLAAGAAGAGPARAAGAGGAGPASAASATGAAGGGRGGSVGDPRPRRPGRAGHPVAFSSSRSRAVWAADPAGLSPVDVAMGVAIPEFDGRIIGPTTAFKEIVEVGDGHGADVVATRIDPGRAERLARLAVRHAELRPAPGCSQADRRRPVRLPDQAQPAGKRRRAGHPRLRHQGPGDAGGGRLPSRPHPSRR